MVKRMLIFIILFMCFLFVFSGVVLAQKSLDDILYSDFKEIESFGYIQVKVQGEQAKLIGLSSTEMTDYARLKYKNNFNGIPFQEITAEESSIYQEEQKAKKVGSIWFRIWITGEGFPVAYYIECKAGNYHHYEIWTDEVLGFCDAKEINQISRNEINRMIENLAITFFKVRDEL